MPIAAWRRPPRMSRRGGASSSWNGRASVSAPALSRAGGGTPAGMNSGSKPPCRSSFGGRRVGEVRRGRSGRPCIPGPRQPDLGHAGATTEEIRCHTLEFAAVGPAFGNRLRHGGCGETTESSPGAPRRSNSPPIPNRSPRSPTSSGFTWIPRERDRASGSQDRNFRACLP